MLVSLVGAAALGCFFLPLVVFGYVSCRDTDQGCTVDQLLELSVSAPVSKEEKIVILQELIAKLVAQLAVLKTETVENETPVARCLDLSQNLMLDSTDAKTGGSVSKLQRFLSDQGMYPEGRITGYYGPMTAEAVVRWQKANGMDFVTTKSGVGVMTREKMRCKAAKNIAVQKIAWLVEKTNPTATDGDYKQYEQTVSIDITTASGTKRHRLGTAYGCNEGEVSKDVMARGQNTLGKVSCYMALTGTSFTMYSDATLIDANKSRHTVRYWVERFDEDASGKTAGKRTTVLEIP